MHRNQQDLIKDSSKDHHRLINQAAEEHPGSDEYHIRNFNDFYRLHPNLCSVIKVSKKIINQSSQKEQWNMNDSEVNTSKTIKIKKVSIEIINVSNMSLQRIINESSTMQQVNINVSEISTKKLSLIFASKSSKCYQRFFIGSSTVGQWSSKGTTAFCWSSH